MVTIGINEGINSSVVVSDNGKILFALQEERVNRIKEFVGFPHSALDFTFKYLGLDPKDVETVCLSNLISPNFTKEEFEATYEAGAQTMEDSMKTGGIIPFIGEKTKLGARAMLRKALPASLVESLRQKVHQENVSRIEGYLRDHGLGASKVVRTHHHLNHAASAYFGCRKNAEEPHLILSLDGGGDYDCAHVYKAQNGKIELLASTEGGNSIGNIYSRVTFAMGMRPHEHEYKLMGMAAYASRKYSRKAYDVFTSYLDVDPANPLKFKRLTPEDTTEIIPRIEKDIKRIRFDNVCGGLQFFTEDLLVRWVQECIKITGIGNVVAAGGVFMNVKANKLIAELPEVKYFDVFPSCGDETLPFGAVWMHHAANSPDNGSDIVFDSFWLGPDPSYDLAQAEKVFDDRCTFGKVENPSEKIAELMHEGTIIARCSGPMEFGARALGNRSILADPADYRIIHKINKAIKMRDFWMPFAPAMLIEDCRDYVRIPETLPQGSISPYMMHTFDSTSKRGLFEAGVHPYDGTARAQIVSPKTHPAFHDVISRFKAKSGKGVSLNTSFNLHGYPIVMGAVDAVDVLVNSGLTHLMVNDTLVVKKDPDMGVGE